MSSGDDKRRLGRGLNALLPSRPPISAPPPGPPQATIEPIGGPRKLPLEVVFPNEDQPRAAFREQPLEELAESIRVHGVIQPIIVRRVGMTFQIVAGERRWRAAKLAGLREIPVHVHSVKDEELLEVALIENIQREDLNPIELALAFDRLTKELGLSQEEIGRRTGKDRATVANFLRLLRLAEPVRTQLGLGQLSMGHARALLSLQDEEKQVELCTRVIKDGWSVRQVEREVQKLLGDAEPAQAPKPKEKEDPNVRAAVENLERALGTRVRIASQGGKRGRIEIEYYSQEELDRLYYLLVGEERDE